MDVIVGKRGSGKTAALVEWAYAAPPGELRFIVCHSFSEARLMLNAYPWLKEEQVGTLADLKVDTARLRGWSSVVLGFDNLDLILGNLLAWPLDIGVVTVTGLPFIKQGERWVIASATASPSTPPPKERPEMVWRGRRDRT